MFSNLNFRQLLFWVVALLFLQVFVLYLMGRPIICTCGFVKLWEGDVLSSGTSQHLTDWYSFTHIVHGFIFYLLMSVLFPRLSIKQRFLLAVGSEVGWEIIENTPWVINQYREQALAQGYVGDSIINSIMDIVAMSFGFVLAWRLPVKISIVLVLVLEIFLAYFIRDNLSLNILNFFYQFDFIKTWQSGA